MALVASAVLERNSVEYSFVPGLYYWTCLCRMAGLFLPVPWVGNYSGISSPAYA